MADPPSSGTCERPAARRAAGEIEGPDRPLAGGSAFRWLPGLPCLRIYHRYPHARSATDPRTLQLRSQGGRFDPHVDPDDEGEAPPRSVLYLAERFETAVCEALASAAVEDSLGRLYITVCPARYVALVTPHQEAVDLQDLAGDSPESLGAPADLGHGPWAREDTQAWARAIHDDRPAGPRIAGVRYLSAGHRNAEGGRGVNVAVWESAPPLRTMDDGTGSAEISLTGDRARWQRIERQLRAIDVRPDRIPSSECGRCQRAAGT